MLKELKEIKFIKRDGRIQDFDYDKMMRYLIKIGIKKQDAETLISDFFEDTNQELHTSQVLNILEKIASRRISPAKPEFETYAGILFLEGVKNRDYRGKYPKIEFIFDSDKINKEAFSNFTKSDFSELNEYIDTSRDSLFNYKSSVIFHSKYCIRLFDNIRELPQIAYMRVAMFLCNNSINRLQDTKRIYDALSLHKFTLATPIMVNAGTYRPQTSSCVLITAEDGTNSLLDVNTKIGVMSKNIAGIACNIERIRAKGSEISNGITSGPVPFLKVFEATVSAWNQGGTRPGALCIYFPWWHLDVMDMLSLRSNGGIDENRARRLKYALKINQLFIDKVLKNEEIALLSPHLARDLHGKVGDEFNKAYQKYLDDPNTKKIPAREVWVKMFKERSETGNIYLFHEENVNNPSMLNDYIGSSNLCTEVVLPTKPSSNYEYGEYKD